VSPQLYGALSRHIEVTSFVSELPDTIARVRNVLGDASFNAASACLHDATDYALSLVRQALTDPGAAPL
jgi:hypothetical protein